MVKLPHSTGWQASQKSIREKKSVFISDRPDRIKGKDTETLNLKMMHVCIGMIHKPLKPAVFP